MDVPYQLTSPPVFTPQWPDDQLIDLLPQADAGMDNRRLPGASVKGAPDRVPYPG